MPKPSSPPRPYKLRSVLGVTLLALALLVPASASAWVREAAPGIGAFFQGNSSMSVLPDGSLRYIAATGKSPSYGNQLVVRPPSGPAVLAAPFPAAFGQYSSDNFLSLSAPDASGGQLVVREASPFGVALLGPGADPAGVTVEPTKHVTAIDLAPSGEAAAILSENSEAFVSFRAAGPAGRFDAPRKLDRMGAMRSYAIGITVDPDGGVFVIYRTEQSAGVLQAYAPPGGDFGAPQQIMLPGLTLNLSSWSFGQSSNGHGVFIWDESTGGDNNSEEVWAMTRAPGGLLGPKERVVAAPGGRIVSAIRATVTDDGTAYAHYLDSGPIVCPNNTRHGGSVLAVKGAGGGPWTALNTPSTGNERYDVEALASSGNRIGVLGVRKHYPVNICDDKDMTSAAEVQLGQGAALGGAQVIAREAILGNISTLLRPRGFAVNAGGAAAVLLNEPQSAANDSLPFLYTETGAPVPVPAPPAKPLPAPGKIKLSGKKLVVVNHEFSFETSCTRLPGEGNKLFCSIGALLTIEEKMKGNKAKGSAAASATKGKGKKAKVKLRVIATAKPVKVPVGKTKRIKVKLNKLGQKKLAAAKKAGLAATLKVTINRAGYAPNVIERKVKLIPGKAKAKGKGKSKGKGAKGGGKK